MNDFDYEAVVYEGEVYCVDCLPSEVDIEDPDVEPIFAGSEWDIAPVCCACGEVHDYMNILGGN